MSFVSNLTENQEASIFSLSKKFNPIDPVLSDHVVMGKRTLPAAVYIEMAIVASRHYLGKGCNLLQDLRFESVFICDGDSKVLGIDIEVVDKKAAIAFTSKDGNHPKTHATMTACEANHALGSNNVSNLEEILGKDPKIIIPEESGHIYNNFQKAGLEYGVSFRVIDGIRVTEDDELVSRLVLPCEALSDFDSYVLHPSIIDGAFQSSLLLLGARGQELEGTYVPTSVESISIQNPLTETCYAHVRFCDGLRGENNARTHSFDITIFNDTGEEAARIQRLSGSMVSETKYDSTDINVDGAYSLNLYKQVWRKKALSDHNHANLIEGVTVAFLPNQSYFTHLHEGLLSVALGAGKHSLIVATPGSEYRRLETDVYVLDFSDNKQQRRFIDDVYSIAGKIDRVLYLTGDYSDVRMEDVEGFVSPKAVEEYALPVLHLLQSLGAHSCGGDIRVVIGYVNSPIAQVYFGALPAMCRTISSENPHMDIACIELEYERDDEHDSTAIRALLNEVAETGRKESEIRYIGGGRHIRIQVPTTLRERDNPINNGSGTCIISGGMGALGVIFAQYIAKTTGGSVVLLGRRELGADDTLLIDSLNQSGYRISYLKCDITDRNDVKLALNNVRENLGNITGVIHAAGVLRDALYMRKSDEEFIKVVKPKILGVTNLDVETRSDKLQYFVSFSSISAIIGNPGQVDYAYGNSFLDRFSELRTELVKKGERYGKSISINWPLWKDGGMKVPEDMLAAFSDRTGMEVLDTETGLNTFRQVLSSSVSQIIPIKGIRRKIEKFFSVVNEPSLDKSLASDSRVAVNRDESGSLPVVEDSEETTEVLHRLAVILSAATRTDVAEISADTTFETIGVDSFVVLQVNSQLEKEFGALPKTLMYQVSTLGQLAKSITDIITKKNKEEHNKVEDDVQFNDVASTRHGADGLKSDDNVRANIKGYLKDLFADLLKTDPSEIGENTRFETLGVDSFFVLQANARLEREIGSIPSTVLYKTKDIDGLSEYLLLHNRQFFDDMQDKVNLGIPEVQPEEWGGSPLNEIVNGIELNSLQKQRARILGSDELKTTEWEGIVSSLLSAYGSEASVAVARESLAPEAFIGSNREALFFVNTRARSLLAFAYVGPMEQFISLVRELLAYAEKNDIVVNILETDSKSKELAKLGLSTTPFGAIQYLPTIKGFDLRGSKMRRLRYQVNNYANSGDVRTEEYFPGKNPDTDRDIAHLVDAWAAHKEQIGPYVWRFKKEIEAGAERDRNRVFLTFRNGELDNVIVITRLGEGSGYLMDLEFYPKDMPLGGLEFAIVNIISELKKEGVQRFSFGATFGTQLAPVDGEDSGVGNMLRELHAKGALNNDGNYQFKNKFRSVSERIFVCRRSDEPSDTFADVLLMFADPEQQRDVGYSKSNKKEYVCDKSSKASIKCTNQLHTDPQPGAKERARLLEEYEYNALRIPSRDVAYDLKTDSWAELESDFVRDSVNRLASQDRVYPNFEDVVRNIFPFTHVFVVSQGRFAESLLVRALGGSGMKVPQNSLFPTYIYHQINAGMVPVNVGLHRAWEADDAGVFRGNLDVDKVRAEVEQGNVLFVCVELSSNGTGGYPVSLENLRKLREITHNGGVPLFLDATRALENVLAVIKSEPSYKDSDVKSVLLQMFSLCDGITASLTKDFGIDRGAVIGLNDPTLASVIQELLVVEGKGLRTDDENIITRALVDMDGTIRGVTERVRAVKVIAEHLRGAGLPVPQSVGGHCVLLDLAKNPEVIERAQGVQEFINWMFVHAGIRGAEHMGGIGENTPPRGIIRLAVPIGIYEHHAVQIARNIVSAYESFACSPRLRMVSTGVGMLKAVNARYEIESGRTYARSVFLSDETMKPSRVDNKTKNYPLGTGKAGYDASNTPAPDSRNDIAIVGINFRFPGGDGFEQFWDLLSRGGDAITEIPVERWDHRKQRNRRGETDTKWGGFIEDVAGFDPLFFNISPREAEMMDPQERLFLQCAYSALEDAGYTRDNLGKATESRAVGVFVGAVWSLYHAIGVEETSSGNIVTPNSFHWSIANRVSYFLDLYGPSLSLDSACSSSLTALHIACESIRNGESRMAIVGGVNLDLHPSKPLVTNQGDVLSKDGRCRSFGDGATGYVPGEGVGAIVIKPLSDAIADHDHVYGIIKGTAINHGGRSNGYTVPNPNAQASLIKTVLDRSGVDPSTISYVEAHGTGTALGDPIEITGLTDAFTCDSRRENHKCAIGSVKTNIGHLEAAAGIAGVVKVLLQMMHKKLVPSLHADVLNPHIDFDNTPFYVQRKLTDWSQIIDAEEIPLRAAVSSFGAGGTNAHVLIESYNEIQGDSDSVDSTPELRHLIVLSAKNEDRLRVYARALRKKVDKMVGEAYKTLADVAYTLQVGREHFEVRLAIITESYKDLSQQLDSFLNDDDPRGLWYFNVLGGGRKAKNKAPKYIPPVNADPDDVAKRWVNGQDIDFYSIHSGGARYRVSLPTYPFARERYWVETSAKDIEEPEMESNSSLHPLLGCRAEDERGLRYEKEFSGNEFVLKDHVVVSDNTLPGVVYIEMARAACIAEYPDRDVSTVRNIVWSQPIMSTDSGKTVGVELSEKQDGISVSIVTGEGAERIVHGQCKIVASESDSDLPLFDLEHVRGECSQRKSRGEIYATLRGQGMFHGPAFQVLDELVYDETQALGKLSLPDQLDSEFNNFVLHPAILDGALQVAAAFAKDNDEPTGVPDIPFSITKLEQFKKLAPECYAHAKIDALSTDKVKKFNIELISMSGERLLTIDAFSVRTFKPATTTAVQVGRDKLSTVIPQWVATPRQAQQAKHFETSLLVMDLTRSRMGAIRRHDGSNQWRQVVGAFPGPTYEKISRTEYELDPRNPEHFKALMNDLLKDDLLPSHILHLYGLTEPNGLDDNVSHHLGSSIYCLSRLGRAWLDVSPAKELTIVTAFHESVNQSGLYFSALGAFGKSLCQEYPKVRFLSAGFPDCAQSRLEESIDELATCPTGATEVSYMDGTRHEKAIVTWDMQVFNRTGNSERRRSTVFQEDSVYLITGGVGGIGRILAEYLANGCNARVGLIGRSPLSNETEKHIAGLGRKTGQVRYYMADVTRTDQLADAIARVERELGDINGVFHCAGITRDSLLANKSDKDIEEVLSPKIQGSQNLDLLTKDKPLDFFALFSSIASITGNRGQTDYAYANRFMDDFAAWRSECVKRGERQGTTVSINWPLWEKGGMGVSPEVQAWLEKTYGMQPIPTREALLALEEILREDVGNVCLLYGDAERLQELVSGKKTSSGNPHHQVIPKVLELQSRYAPAPANAANSDDSAIREEVVENLVELVSRLLKLSRHDLDPERDMSDYGLDSIVLTEFTSELNSMYNIEIMPTVFFEYTTVGELADYLLDEHKDEVIAAVGAPATSGENADLSIEKETSAAEGKTPILEDRYQESEQNDSRTKKIAIIGAHGIFPGSKNLDEFWENLAAGKDLVSEVPSDRFDWRAYVGDPYTDDNKMISPRGGFVDDIDKFDPLFFKISPIEAEFMDPQQRLFLQTVWGVIEDAGYAPEELSNTKTSIFAAVATSDYHELLHRYYPNVETQATTGNAHSVLPNRISHFLNLRGPSEPVDTACSSSLVTIHRAVKSILSGESEMAIAGGVGAMLTPTTFISFSRAGMLAKDGKCKTFDHRADGYVRGEGSAAVLLKDFDRAVEDGDNILGVIRGTAVNHGGHATSLTAPNPHSQADVLVDAYRTAEVNVDTVTYIEAHGTGTKLGDPVEINGLKRAFKALAKEQGVSEERAPHCGLGSVKSNIGHLEAAAGIAGVIKVLLAMRNEALPPTIHIEEVNPYIDLKNTPFYINTELKPWVADAGATPRRAGVSSFGFGGVNAHVVLEAYDPELKYSDRGAETTLEPQLFIISAKTEEALQERASDLISYLNKSPTVSAQLDDVAYTLQIGRTQMQYRLAILTSSLRYLKSALNAFLRGEDYANMFAGEVRTSAELTNMVPAEKSIKQYADELVRGEFGEKLGRLWVNGVNVNWKEHYHGKGRKRVSLPSYPFAKERYWISMPEPIPQSQHALPSTNVLHPLIDTNVSSFSEVSFQKSFLSTDHWLTDHIIKGRPMLPGAVSLEMARAAGELALKGKPFLKLTDVKWLKPVMCEQDRHDIQVQLREANGEGIDFVIVDGDDNKTVYSKGNIHKTDIQDRTDRKLDIQAIKQRCQHSWSNDQVYRQFREIGFEYGPAFQVITTLWGSSTESLGFVELPENAWKNSDDYVLHPAIVDGALQCIDGICKQGTPDPLRSSVPVSLAEITVTRDLTNRCYVHVQRSDALESSDGVSVFNLDVCDELGNILLYMRGFSVKSINVFSIPNDGSQAVVRNRGYDVEQERAEEYVGGLIAKALRISTGMIRAEKNFDEYGIDSLSINRITRKLEDAFGKLPRTLFFEYANLRELTAYLLKIRKAAFVENGSVTGGANDLLSFVKALIAKSLRIDPSKIDPNMSFDQYGIDSLSINRLMKSLEENFGRLPKTLFIEYSNLAALTEYLAKNSVNINGEAIVKPMAQQEMALPYVGKLVAEALRIDESRIDFSKDFNEYGIDSLVIGRLSKKLESEFGPLPKTIFFENRNLEELVSFLMKNHKVALDKVLGGSSKSVSADSAMLTPSLSNLELVRYQPCWLRSPVAVSEKERILVPVLLFTPSQEFSDYFQSAWVTRGGGKDDIYHVFAGGKCSHDGRYHSIRPDYENDYRELFEFLGDHNQLPFLIINAWNWGLGDDIDNLHTTFFMGKQLVPRVAGPTRLYHLAVHRDGLPIPEQSSVVGLVSSFSREEPRLKCRVVELDHSDSNYDLACDVILAEAFADTEVRHVRYHYGERYIRQLKNIETASNVSGGSNRALFKSGVYMVTGGAGGLGLQLSRYLVSEYGASVVIIGRSDESSVSERLDSISDTRERVLYLQADITDTVETFDAFSAARECFGQVNGVFHCAGGLRDGLVQSKSREEFDEVLSIKSSGLENIISASEKEPSSFIVAFSSVVALLGNAGQSDYACANAYMDSLAEAREVVGSLPRVISIDWPLWENGGMSIDEVKQEVLFETTGMKAMPSELGLKVLMTIVQEKRANECVLYGDQRFIQDVFSDLFDASGTDESKDVSAKHNVEQSVKRIVASALGVKPDDLEGESDLDVASFDLIAVSEVSAKLYEEFGVSLSVSQIYEQGTIGGVLQKLFSLLQGSAGNFHRSLNEFSEGNSNGEPISGEAYERSLTAVLDDLDKGLIDVDEAVELI